jgi:hypothetical protein
MATCLRTFKFLAGLSEITFLECVLKITLFATIDMHANLRTTRFTIPSVEMCKSRQTKEAYKCFLEEMCCILLLLLLLFSYHFAF